MLVRITQPTAMAKTLISTTASKEARPKLLYSNGATTRNPLPMIDTSGVTMIVHIRDRPAVVK
jgi:hypothetical protein